MSTSRNVYLGPYFECDSRTASEDVVADTEEDLDDSIILVPGNGAGYHFENTGMHIWIPNREGDHLNLPTRERAFTLVPVIPERISEEISKFADAYADELSVLRRAYGDQNVCIPWGMIFYAW